MAIASPAGADDGIVQCLSSLLNSYYCILTATPPKHITTSQSLRPVWAQVAERKQTKNVTFVGAAPAAQKKVTVPLSLNHFFQLMDCCLGHVCYIHMNDVNRRGFESALYK